MRFLIIGPGAMGCLLAALLKLGGQEVSILDYREERARRLSEKGITLEGLSGKHTLRLPVITRPSGIGPHLAILCVKAYRTRDACLGLKGFLEEGSVVITLQNGVGNLEVMEEVLGRHRVSAGVTSEGATLLGEGHVRHAGRGETVIGRGQLPAGLMEELIFVLNNCGLKARWQEDATGLIWGKLLVNVGINGLTCLMGVRNGVLAEDEDLRVLLEALVSEALEVVKAKGITLPFESPVMKVLEVCRDTKENISSMLQDIKKGKRTEISVINGAIYGEGKRLHIPTPYNETILRLVTALENTKDKRV